MTGNLAIIPVRTGSKRLPQKNLRNFHGRPLFTYSIDCALQSGLFEEIHVSSESAEVAAICEKFKIFPKFMRPQELSTDTATLQQVCEYVINEYERREYRFNNFCILWATAPLRTSQDVQNAYAMLTEGVDAVVGVTDYDLPVFCAQRTDDHSNLTPLFPEMVRLPSWEMPKVVCDNGTFCWVKIDSFKKYGTWLPPKLKGYWMPKNCSVDIDAEDDWELAEYYYKRKTQGGRL